MEDRLRNYLKSRLSSAVGRLGLTGSTFVVNGGSVHSFASSYVGGAQFDLRDGRVRFVSENTDQNTLSPLGAMNDGHVVEALRRVKSKCETVNQTRRVVLSLWQLTWGLGCSLSPGDRPELGFVRGMDVQTREIPVDITLGSK